MHFLQLTDHDAAFALRVLDRAEALRKELREQGKNTPVLERKTLAMVFEHPSLRTRVSFETAMTQLGGHAINLQNDEIGLNTREPAGDVGQVIGGMVDAIAARLRKQETLVDLAAGCPVPVVNALTDLAHPCQALADLLTLRDVFGPDLEGRRVCYVGDSNNVLRSLIAGCGMAGVSVVASSPDGYQLSDEDAARLRQQVPGLDLTVEKDPAKAVDGCDAIYTDVWASMGQEAEKAERLKAFEGYAVSMDLLGQAKDEAIVMHCLPAHRGEEIEAEVMDSPRSQIFPQAHNRLHAQKGLLATLLES